MRDIGVNVVRIAEFRGCPLIGKLPVGVGDRSRSRRIGGIIDSINGTHEILEATLQCERSNGTCDGSCSRIKGRGVIPAVRVEGCGAIDVILGVDLEIEETLYVDVIDGADDKPESFQVLLLDEDGRRDSL